MVTTTTGLATSYINFSRASLATVTNNVGNIAWAGNNILTNSESFDNSSWFKGGITISANAIAAPDGTITADICTTTNTTPAIYQAVVAPGPTVTFSVFVKTGSGVTKPSLEFLIRNNTTSTNFDIGTFDTSTGAITGSGWSSTAVGSNWYLVSYTRSSGITAGNSLFVYPGWTGSTTTIGQTWAIWGAHLYRSDLGGMVFNPAMPAGMGTYYPTTPRNLLGYTEDLSNASWTISDILAFGAGSISNAATAPNDLQTADMITENTANAIHSVYQLVNLPIGGTPYTVSAYFKAGTRSSSLIRIGGPGYTAGANPLVRFSLFGGGAATVLSTGAAVTGSSIVALSNGWYRCSVTFTTGTNTIHAVSLCVSDGGSSATYTGNGTGSVYVWGAQLSDSASIDPYTPVYGAAVTSAAYYAPRLDYSPATIQPLGLLVEEARTNLQTASEDFSAAAWTKTEATVTADATASPTGGVKADLIIPSTVSGAHWVAQDASVTTGLAYTQSIFAKAGGYSWLQITESSLFGITEYVNINLSNGQLGAASGYSSSNVTVTDAGNGWWRISVKDTATITGTTGRLLIVVLDANTASRLPAFAGDGTSGVYLWGAQLEAGSFATSYIPTGSATATRAADVASVSTQAFPYSGTEGTLVVSASIPSLSGERTLGNFTLSTDGTGTGERGQLRVNNSGTASTLVANGGSLTGSATSSNSVLANSVFKAGYALASNDLAVVLNGGTAATDGTVTLPSYNELRLGRLGSGGELLNGHIRQITYLPRRISNAELQTRTTL